MKKIFTNDSFYFAATLLTIISAIIYIIIFIPSGAITPKYCITELVRLLCIAVLYISYKHHDKNVMKSMLGSMLMLIFIMTLFGVNDLGFGTFYVVLKICSTVIATALFISHYVINFSHKASPKKILLNQILCVLYALFLLVDFILVAIKVNVPLIGWIGSLSGALANIGTAICIVCVESRIDAYRLNRQAAGWTEENGYPEGYVHEYEKKGK